MSTSSRRARRAVNYSVAYNEDEYVAPVVRESSCRDTPEPGQGFIEFYLGEHTTGVLERPTSLQEAVCRAVVYFGLSGTAIILKVLYGTASVGLMNEDAYDKFVSTKRREDNPQRIDIWMPQVWSQARIASWDNLVSAKPPKLPSSGVNYLFPSSIASTSSIPYSFPDASTSKPVKAAILQSAASTTSVISNSDGRSHSQAVSVSSSASSLRSQNTPETSITPPDESDDDVAAHPRSATEHPFGREPIQPVLSAFSKSQDEPGAVIKVKAEGKTWRGRKCARCIKLNKQCNPSLAISREGMCDACVISMNPDVYKACDSHWGKGKISKDVELNPRPGSLSRSSTSASTSNTPIMPLPTTAMAVMHVTKPGNERFQPAATISQVGNASSRPKSREAGSVKKSENLKRTYSRTDGASSPHRLASESTKSLPRFKRTQLASPEKSMERQIQQKNRSDKLARDIKYHLPPRTT